jgi:hypothetical protein
VLSCFRFAIAVAADCDAEELENKDAASTILISYAAAAAA